MASRIVSLENLQDSDVKSKALAQARIVKSLAGRLRYAYELATGAQVTADEPRAVGPNPSGDFGINSSGPPWGPAMQAPNGGRGGMKPDSANFIGQHLLIPELKRASADNNARIEVPIRHFVQAYEVQTHAAAPLSRLYPVIRMYCLPTGSNIDVTVTARSQGQPTGRTRTFTVTTVTEEVFEHANLWFDVDGGEIAPMRLIFECDSSIGVAVSGFSLNVTTKLGYSI